MLLPACTGTGFALLVTARSAESATCILTVALLLPPFGSVVVEETESVCVIVVPCATVVPTVTTNVKLAVVLAVIAAVSVQVSVASTQFHVPGPLNDTAVAPVGSASVN